MKKLFFLTAVVCLAAAASFAQTSAANFSGTWTLDVSKSKLDERSRIESMTMTVAQTDKELKVTTETKRQAPPTDAAQGEGRRGMGRGFGQGDGTTTYSLDGKETVTQRETRMGSVPVKQTAMLDQGRVRISTSSTFSGQMGEMTIGTKETWSLSSDGKTLTVERETTSPRGTNSSTMVFGKK